MAGTADLTIDKLFDVRDYVCVVTGGGSGIGLMAAQALAANGARGVFNMSNDMFNKDLFSAVYIVGRRKEALDRAVASHDPAGRGGKIVACQPCDVTKKYDLENLAKEISSKEKCINLLTTAAGIAGPKAEPDEKEAKSLREKLWTNESFEQWNDTYNTDVTAVYFTVVAFLPLLQAGTESHGHLSTSVIVISSMSGIMRHAQGHFSYNAAKGGTVHLTKLMSAEFQNLGVRVNSIAPGYFPSEMTAKESGPDMKSQLPAEYAKEKGHVPMQRAGTDQEMAQAVCFWPRIYM